MARHDLNGLIHENMRPVLDVVPAGTDLDEFIHFDRPHLIDELDLIERESIMWSIGWVSGVAAALNVTVAELLTEHRISNREGT